MLLARIRKLVATTMATLSNAAVVAAVEDGWRSAVLCPLAVYSVELVVDRSLHPWLMEVGGGGMGWVVVCKDEACYDTKALKNA